MIASGRIQHHAAESMENRILLHIQSHKLIHKAFEKLPHNSYRHGEAERYYGEKERRQIKGELLIVIEKQNKRKAYRRTEESVQRMQDCVPSGDHDVKSIDLSQDLRGKNKTKNRNLQSGGNLDPQFYLYPAWYIKQQKCQDAEKQTFIIMKKRLADQTHQHKKTQDIKHDKRASVFLQFHFNGLTELFSPLPFFFLYFIHLSIPP